jgi:hypothetical protein
MCRTSAAADAITIVAGRRRPPPPRVISAEISSGLT